MKKLIAFTYIIVLILMTGCADMIDHVPTTGLKPDGTASISFHVPEESIVSTRAVSVGSAVNNLTMIIFRGENEGYVQMEQFFATESSNTGKNRFEPTGNGYLITFKLNSTLKSSDNLRVYFIANAAEKFSTAVSITESELKALKSEALVSSGNYIMSAKTDGSCIFSNSATHSSVPLLRNAAKVTVTGSEASPQKYPFKVFGSAQESPLFAGGLPLRGEASAAEISETDVTETEAVHIHPTSNGLVREAGKCFVIVKAPFEGTEYFYRLDFVQEDAESGKPTLLDINPNHWYQFIITSVDGPGYDSPAEAAKHPECALSYEIHDHSPKSFNMTSDGIRELGVTHAVRYSGTETADGTDGSEKIYIKVFSKLTDEIPTAEELKEMITIEDDTWLEIGEIQQCTDPGDIGGDSEQDPNDTGKVYSCNLRFKKTALTGELTTKIKVKWGVLSREIPVTWIREFNGSQLTSCKLIMSYNDTDTPIEDYWGFLESTESHPAKAPTYTENKLWGISETANNGKVRNRGFHFPVMYGDRTTGEFASYSYTLTFDKEERFKTSAYTWECSVSGDPAIKDHVSVAGSTGSHVAGTAPLSLTISRPARPVQDDYDYATGTLSIKITFEDTGKTETYTFDLYHTGFFHKNPQEHRLDKANKDDVNYYYYEVVPIMEGNRQRYWLDRNLGAKSAEMYVRISDGTTLYGNPDAAGGFYTVARQRVSEYKDPLMFDFDPTNDRVSPPGYRVPKQKVWDSMVNSSSFHTESAGEYFHAYYDTGNPKIGRVYFPKTMFYNNGAILGESRAGYYWTSTASTGTEKEEIGKWLKMLMVSGSTMSYVNGCVTVEGKESQAYGASVRCINDVEDSEVLNRVSFNVSGATHVYLYKEEADGRIVPTTTWPGHAIGTYNTMKEGNWFGFAFESTDFQAEDLYVIFNYVDSNGIIHTFSRDTLSGETLVTSDLSAAECRGWKAIGDPSPQLKDVASTPSDDLIPTQSSAIGSYWKCSLESKTVKCYKEQIKEYEICWPTPKISIDVKIDGYYCSTYNIKLGPIILDSKELIFKSEFAARMISDKEISITLPGFPTLSGKIGELFSRDNETGKFRLNINQNGEHCEKLMPLGLPKLEEGNQRIFFLNKIWTLSDSNLRIWYWGPEGNTPGTWPGQVYLTQLIVDGVQLSDENGNLWWYVDIPATMDNLIIINTQGNSVIARLDRPINGCVYSN